MEFKRIIVVMIIVILPFSSGKKPNRQQTRCILKENGGNCSAVELKCRNGSVIYKPEVFGDIKCKKSKISCKGWSPNLLVEKVQCYWTPSCIVRFPKTPLIMGGCEYRFAKCLRILDWKCLQKDAQRFFMINATASTENEIGGETIDKGIVRSHDSYPWNYNHKTFENCFNGNCLLHFSPVDDNWKQYVIITVDSVDIDTDNDAAFIESGSQSHKLTDLVGKTKPFGAGQEVNLHFQTKGDNEFGTKGGMGFVICFKFANTTQDSNVCDELMTPGLRLTLSSCPDSEEEPSGNLWCRKKKRKNRKRNKGKNKENQKKRKRQKKRKGRNKHRKGGKKNPKGKPKVKKT